MKKKLFALVLSLAMVLSLAACGGESTPPADGGGKTGDGDAAPAADPIVLKFSDCHNPTAVNHLAFKLMADYVKEATDGAVEIEVYPSSQLGDVAASQEAIQMNTVDMAVDNLAVIGSAIPEFGAVGGPFIFESDEHVERALSGELGQYYKDKAAEKHMTICGYLMTGFRHTFTDVPVTGVSDFAGLKIRTMENPVDVGIFNAIGAQATPMAYGELFTAIQQGTVDGGENTIANYLSDGFWEIAPYLALSGHTYNVCPVIISDAAIEKIPAGLRDTFFQACEDGIAAATDYVLQANEDAVAELKAKGCTISEIDREALYDLCAPLYTEFSNDRIPADLTAMVEAAK